MVVFPRVLTTEKQSNSKVQKNFAKRSFPGVSRTTFSAQQKKARESQALLDEIRRSESALTLAYMNFEHVVDPALIDCSIYELNAAQMRYQYLLEKAKQYGLKDIGFQAAGHGILPYSHA